MYKYNVYTGTYIIVKLQNISPKIFAMFENWTSQRYKNFQNLTSCKYIVAHGLRRPREEIAFTAQPKIKFQSQIVRYGRSIFCLPHRPNFSDFVDLCLHWMSVVRDSYREKKSVIIISIHIMCRRRGGTVAKLLYLLTI